MMQSMNRLVYLTMIFAVSVWFTALFLSIFSRSASAGGDTCFVSLNNNTNTDYQSMDASAVQTAVNAANPDDLLKIAGDCIGVNNLGVQTQTVYITKPLTLRGGYNEGDWTMQPNPDLYTTTLNADRNGRVLLITGTIDVTLENLHITGGDTTELPNISPMLREGGGIWSNSNVTITNSKVISNIGNWGGGGIAIRSGGSLDLQNSNVLDNLGDDGGGILLYESEASQIINSRIAGNYSDGYGGGIHDDGKGLLLLDTIIESNEDENGGGGMWSGNDDLLSIINTHFIQNRSTGGNGALFENDGPIYIANSSFISNTGNGAGGGIHFSSVPTITISSSEFRGNQATNGGAIDFGSSSDNVHIIDSAFRYNVATAHDGGAIYNFGTLFITNSTFISNTANDEGGAIYSQNHLSVDQSTISENYGDDGGGIFNNGTIQISNSTIDNNMATNGGGGLFNRNEATLTNSTVSHNSAPLDGGGVFNFSNLTMTHTTIVSNSSNLNGGMYNGYGDFSFANSIIANNIGNDCYLDFGTGTFTDFGYNLDEDGGCVDNATITATTSITNIEPMLGPLTDNGGATRTHAPLAGSEAIDFIPENMGECGLAIATDQRGFKRPFDGNFDSLIGCDIGAHEVGNITFLPTIIK